MIKTQTDHTEDIAMLGQLIKGIRVVMMTTHAPDGTLRSRPMMAQQSEIEADLWFFTSARSSMVSELKENQRVNLTYAIADLNRYVSVSGRASLVRDAEKAKQLWRPTYEAWIPRGLEDPDLLLLKVSVELAEYWDQAVGKMVSLPGYIKDSGQA